MDNPTEGVDGRLRVKWRAIGSAGLDIAGKLKFPKVPTEAGLYRFWMTRSDGTKAAYVGETDNIQRRFTHYRNPGPSQITNLRLNALFKTVLLSGGGIEVSTVTDTAWIVGEKLTTADFTEKSVRRLFENFVLVFSGSIDVEQLNR